MRAWWRAALPGLGILAVGSGPVLAAPADTAWVETVRIPAEAAWVAGVEAPPESLACRFGDGEFTIDGVRLFRRCGDLVTPDPKLTSDLQKIPRVRALMKQGASFRDAAAVYNDEIDSLLVAGAAAFRAKGPAAAMAVLESSDLLDEALVTGYEEIRIRRKGRGKEWNVYPALIRQEATKPERAREVVDRLRALTRWPSPPAALIITSSGEVVPLTGGVAAARAQTRFLLAGGDPQSLPPGPIWKDSEDVLCDFLAAARRSRSR